MRQQAKEHHRSAWERVGIDNQWVLVESETWSSGAEQVARADIATAASLLRGVAGNSPAASAVPVSGTVLRSLG